MSYQQLWAPWRMAYVSGEDATEPDQPPAELVPGGRANCFLCRCVGPGDDRRRLVVARTALTVTVMNRFPYNNGHLLVAPQRHCGTLAELRREERLELMDILTRMVEVLKTILSPEGFNIGLNLGAAAGAGLPDHLHWHIVPRWVGDTSFMTCLASVRVIPQALEALWERLQEELK